MTRPLVEFHSNGDAFARRLAKKAAEVERAGRKGLVGISELWIKVQKKEFQPFSLNELDSAPKEIRSRRGRLRSSVRGSVFGNNLQNLRARLSVGSKWAPYGAIQEWGAKPKPRTAQYMRIPLRAALTPAGKVKSKARAVRSGTTSGGNPVYTSGFGRLVPIRTKKGNLVIVAKRKGRRGKEEYGTKEPLYVLKKSVTVPPRLNARKNLGWVLKKRMPKLRGAIYQILSGVGRASA